MLRPNRVQILVLGIWAGVSIVAGSVLTSFHQPFSIPTQNISSLSTIPHTWRALHLLAADCGCFRTVSEYLATRTPLPGATEEIAFIGAADLFGNRDPLLARGFRVTTLAPESLRPFGVKGVPLLIFISPQDQIVYLGGYGAGSYQDAEIWSRLQRGAMVQPLPVLGCAVGSRLKRELDPFFWKYGPNKSNLDR